MDFPLASLATVSVNNPWSYLVFGLIGFGFGYILESAGFGDSRKLAGQFYFREMTVFKVMFTAISVALVLLFGAVGLGMIDFSQVWVNPTYLGSGLVGGLIMGAGFIIGGFCPTTSLASASTGRIDGMMFMAGGFVGAFVFGETEPGFDNWYNTAGYLGRLTLDQVFSVPAPVIVLIVVLIAIAGFWGAEQTERVVANKDLRVEPAWRKPAAVVLVLAAVGVVMMGSPSLESRYQKASFKRTETLPTAAAPIPAMPGKQAKAPAPPSTPIPAAVTRTYSADEMLSKRLAFVSPEEAFRARFQQEIKPVYLDVRDEADFNLYHLADAVHVPLARLPQMVPALLSEPAANTVFIAMSNDEAAAVKAWKLLVANRVPNAYVLAGGINRWIATFGADDPAPRPIDAAADDQLRYGFAAALGDRYKSCAPSPIEHEKLAFEPRIVLQLKRDKSGGGCG